MKKFVFRGLQAGLLFVLPLSAQARRSASDGLLPAASEFAEFRSIQSDVRLDSVASIAKLPEGLLFAEVGFDKYERRIYATHPSGILTAEAVTLRDTKGAYSLLTLLGRSGPAAGPPGDFVSLSSDSIVFIQSNILVRIQAKTQTDLVARVARQVSGRIKQHDSAPSLIARLPKMGLDAASLRYYLGPRSFARHGHTLDGIQLGFQTDTELAQARYTLQDQTGVFSLAEFPTSELAEDYFERFRTLVKIDQEPEQQIYFKRAGSLLGILAGSFEPLAAEKLLSGMNVTYSVQWILEKKSEPRLSGWGVPGGLLGTVLGALVLASFLAVLGLCAGVMLGGFRFLLRGYAPNNPLDRPERTEIIRLKLK